MAEGSKLTGFLEAVKPYEALGLWHSISSPMLFSMILGFLCIMMVVGFMFPYVRRVSRRETDDGDEIEPDPEADSSMSRQRTRSRTRIEPTAEPPTSRFPMRENSLGTKYPTVMSDVMVRPEGVLVWLRRRCELRVQRQHKVIHNTFRMDVLTDMLRVCLAGMDGSETQTMRDNLSAMCDLSDDENSPRYRTTEEDFLTYVQQAYQAYQIGRGVAERVRRDNAENVEQTDEASTEGEETNEERYWRYVNSSLSDVSQPDLWMEIQNEETIEERFHRYMVSERHDVSDVEYWDYIDDQVRQENEELANQPVADFDPATFERNDEDEGLP